MKTNAIKAGLGACLVTLVILAVSFTGLASWYYAVRFICEETLEEIVPERDRGAYYPGAPEDLTMWNRHDISTSISIMNPYSMGVQVEYRYAFHSFPPTGAIGPASCWTWQSANVRSFDTFNIPRSLIVEEYEWDILAGGTGIAPTSSQRWGGERLEGFVLLRSSMPLLQVAAVYIERDDRFLWATARDGVVPSDLMPTLEGPLPGTQSGGSTDLGGAGGIGSSIDIEYIQPFEL